MGVRRFISLIVLCLLIDLAPADAHHLGAQEVKVELQKGSAAARATSVAVHRSIWGSTTKLTVSARTLTAAPATTTMRSRRSSRRDPQRKHRGRRPRRSGAQTHPAGFRSPTRQTDLPRPEARAGPSQSQRDRARGRSSRSPGGCLR